MIASALYVCADLLASALYDGYSLTDQAISELFAIGAPTRSLILVLFSGYNLLLIAFGAGVLASARRGRELRIVGCLLIASALLGAATGMFFPMHVRGEPRTLTDTMHAVLTAVQSLFVLVMVACAARAFSRAFAIYSAFTVALLIVGGAFAALAGGDIAADEATPWMGVAERMLIYSYMLWTATLAVALLRRERRSA